MPEYLSPGVYVEEIQSGPRPIQGVGTSTAGFVGQTERGPMTPRLVTSWGDYSRWFGDVIDPQVSFLPFSLRGFFENGGLRAFVARVTGTDPVTSASNMETQNAAGDTIPNNVLRIRAIGPGEWGNNIMIWVRNATQADINTLPPRDWFRITVLYYRDGIPVPFIDPTNPANLAHPQRREPTVLEDFDNLTAVAGRSNYVLNVINNNSYLIETDFFNTNTNLPGIAARPRNVGGASSSATVNLVTEDANTVLRVQAVGPGIWANTLTVDVAPGTNENTFQIRVNDSANEVENYNNIPDADPGQAISLVNGTSVRIRLSWASNATVPSRPDDVGAAALEGGANTGMLNGTDGAAISPNDYAGSAAVPPNQRTGLAAIEIIDEVALLIAPDEVNGSIVNNFQITSELVNQCERLRDRFAVLSIPANQGSVQNILKPRDTSYAAAYYPWVRVFDSRTQDTRLVPPAGHVAGIFARSDQQRGVHKAPANEVIRDIVNRDLSPTIRPLEFHLGRGEHDILNPRGINVIRDFRSDGRGIRVYGARTLSSDPLWTYVNVRRLFLYVEESIDEGTQWVVFEPNDHATWARVRQVVSNFLTLVWRSGALFGTRAEDAFFVRCGPDTMTPADIDAGRLICEIGIAPVKPAEFVIFRIQQKTVELVA